jgi:hypothetical protein
MWVFSPRSSCRAGHDARRNLVRGPGVYRTAGYWCYHVYQDPRGPYRCRQAPGRRPGFWMLRVFTFASVQMPPVWKGAVVDERRRMP